MTNLSLLPDELGIIRRLPSVSSRILGFSRPEAPPMREKTVPGYRQNQGLCNDINEQVMKGDYSPT